MDDDGSEAAWRRRYERSVADEERRLAEPDTSIADRAYRWRAYVLEACILWMAALGAVAMIASGEVWLVVGGCVLAALIALAVAGFVLHRR